MRLVNRVLGRLLIEEVTHARARVPRGPDDEHLPSSDAQVQRAKSVRRAFEDLGPLYIKIGQVLSTRPDLVPEYMRSEFENLHDNVSPSPFTDFEPVLERELGRDWRRHFREVDTKTVGAASLAQVYKVVLESGRHAVVKIQRPGIRQMVLDDMAVSQFLVRRIAKWAPDFNDVVDLEAILDVVFGNMRPELDFTLEAENMDSFRARLDDFDTLDIPEVIHVTPRVLVMSLAPGESIRDVDRDALTHEQRSAIGTDLLALGLWNAFVDRRFHADPHPGNLFISPEGRCSILDWGMVARIDRQLAQALVVVLLSMTLNDGMTLARTWIDMGRATHRADVAAFINDMSRFVPGIAGKSLERFNFGVELTRVLKFSAKRGIATSPQVASFGKAFANIEGSVRYIAPHLSITEVFEDEFILIAQELTRELFDEQNAGRAGAQALLLLQNGPSQFRSVLADLANRDFTLRVGEEMGMRSRREDRADARSRSWQYKIAAAALALLWREHRRSRASP